MADCNIEQTFEESSLGVINYKVSCMMHASVVIGKARRFTGPISKSLINSAKPSNLPSPIKDRVLNMEAL